ncbi:MAG: phosphatidate cytidylyltransferase [Actinomycetota bacterium]|nr:phosphatidate cytidylyltransferase [Actinomycetota bacterium]
MPTEDGRTPDDDTSHDDTATSSDSHAAVAGFESTDAPLEPFGEVLSGVMEPHDPDATGELDLPGVNENLNPHPADADPGFDGWLDDDDVSAKSDDPYASLSEADDDDEAASEIADWMAFTGAAADEPPAVDEVEVVVDVTDTVISEEESADVESTDDTDGDGAAEEDFAEEDDDEGDVPIVRISNTDGAGPHENTVEPVVGKTDAEHSDVEGDEPSGDSGDDQPLDAIEDEPSEEIVVGTSFEEIDEADEADEGDPEKLAVLPIVPIAVEAAANDDAPEIHTHIHAHADAEIDQALESDDDTGEIPIIGLVESDVESTGDATVFDGEDFTEEHYLDAATREHHDLAAAIAAAESQDTEQVALSAAIPGLDSGVVGFDDVVDAQGDGTSAPIAPPKSSDLVLRVGTGVALIAAFLLSLIWRPAIIVLALAVFVIAAGEFYSVLLHRKYKPVSIFGFLGIVGAGLGTVVWGVVAIPLAFALMITIILLYDAVSQRRQGAVSGFSLTILVAVWVGGFGAFAFPIIAADNYQALVLTVVGMVALVDIAAYFVGRTIGRRPFAPLISPKKTIEGFVGGVLMALLAGAAASFFVEAIDLPAGLVLGVVVAVVAPLGDLSVSVIKRSLDIKDMGSILPGHGGLLDRIDAIIAVVPAAWATFVWLGLL